MGDLLKTNQLNVTFIDPILSQSAVTDWVLRANAETCRRFVKMLLSYRAPFFESSQVTPRLVYIGTYLKFNQIKTWII